MSVLTELFGKAVDIARKIESVPLQQIIIQLQQQVLELLAEKGSTEEENRALKAQLRERDERDRVRLAVPAKLIAAMPRASSSEIGPRERRTVRLPADLHDEARSS